MSEDEVTNYELISGLRAMAQDSVDTVNAAAKILNTMKKNGAKDKNLLHKDANSIRSPQASCST